MNTKEIEEYSNKTRPITARYYNLQSGLYYRKKYGVVQYYCENTENGKWVRSRFSDIVAETFVKLS